VKQAQFDKPPLHREPFTVARLRIAVALIVQHYRRDKPLFEYPPYGIVVLAGLLRTAGPGGSLHPELVYLAKAVSAGYKLAELPWIPQERTMRSIAKRRVLPRKQ
jgi:hypothetical protein